MSIPPFALEKSPDRILPSSHRSMESQRPTISRAPRACLQCRARKVRCDVMQSTGACTNCLLDLKPCKVNERLQQRYKSDRFRNRPDVAIPVLEPTSSSESSSQRVYPPQPIHTHQWQDCDPAPGTVLQTPKPRTVLLSPSAGTQGRADHLSLPTFVKRLPESLGTDDLLHLAAKGAFVFLPLKLQYIVLSRYVKFIHPLLPLLNLSEFLPAVAGLSEQKIPLTLYHAVMCAGLAAVEKDLLLEHGYTLKSVVRHEYYTKAKLLTDLEVDTDAITCCQVALLLMSWSANDSSKGAAYWSGEAINQARRLKLHRDEKDWALPDISDKRLPRRLWCLVLMKEADVSLGLSVQPRISPRNAPMLSSHDFDPALPVINDEELPGLKLRMMDTSLKEKLEALCIQKAKLSLIIHQMLQKLKRPAARSESSVSPTAQSVSTVSMSWEIWRFSHELEEWYSKFPWTLFPGGLSINSSWERDDIVEVNLSAVILLYWMSMAMLHKHEVAIRGWTYYPDGHDSAGEISVLKLGHIMAMRLAANKIFEMHMNLEDNRLSQHLPTMAVATLCAVAFVYLLDARSEVGSKRQESLRRLDLCVEVLKGLGELNFAAKDIASLVESSVKTAHDEQSPLASSLQDELRNAEHTGDFGVGVAGQSLNARQQPQVQTDIDTSPTLEEAEVYTAPELNHGQNFLEFCGMEDMIDYELDHWITY